MQDKISKRELEELKKVSRNYKKDLKKIDHKHPIQYLIGYVDFYGYKIFVNKNTLIPRPETELLVEKTIKYLRKYNFKNPKILDLCTGSGCIGIALKKELNCITDASDISSKALKTAKKNSKLNKVEINFIKSSLFKKIEYKKYDLIISNPPYVSKKEKLPKEVLKEPHIALFGGNNGVKVIEKILLHAEKHMNDKSILALEINSYSQNIIEKIIQRNFKDIVYIFEKDLNNKVRYLFIFKNCE